MAERRERDDVIDPAEQRLIARRRWLRIGMPIAGVVVILAAILAITWYSYDSNRRDALQLANDVIAAQSARVSREVDAYLAPAPRAVDLLRGVLSDGAFLGTAQGGAEAIGWQILFDNPQLALISYADPQGNFMMVKREPAGSIDTKVILRDGGKRKTTWTRRDARGETIHVEDDPQDEYDPRTRPWFKNALIAKGALSWTSLYIFFTDRKPGLTASAALVDRDGGVAAVFGVDIALDSLSAFLARLAIGPRATAMIVDDEGRLVAFPDAAKTFKREGDRLLPVRLGELDDRVLRASHDEFKIRGHGYWATTIDGERHIIAATPIASDGDRNWTTLVIAPEADFVGFVAEHNRSALLMSLGVVALASLFAGLLIRQGLRADLNAELVVARERARDAQSRAFADLASRASLFDAANDAGLRDLTRIVARTLSARAAALWAVTSDGKALVLKDRRDREHDGHTSDVELAVAELGAFMPTLAAGTTLAIADVANDPRTRELHQHFLQAMGSRAVVVAPILSSDHVLGVVWAEDARADGADVFLQAIANMLAIRFAAATVEQTRAAVASTELGGGRMIRRVAGGPPADDVAMRRASLSDAGERRLRTRAARVEVSQLAAQIFPRATIMVMRFTDAIAIAAPEAVNARVAALDRLARAMQEIAAARAIDYVKILGDSMMAAEGFDDSDAEAAAVAVAEAAIEIQARAARLFTDLGRRLEFRIGIDTGQAIGSPIGDDAHAYNLWGEAVRMATAMADTGVPGGIEVTESTYRLLRERYLFRVRGTFYLGAAGEMSSYLLTGRV